jgi:hypothetical protein
VNVLKPQLKHTVVTLLERAVSQHEISRKTGIDRKTIRRIAQALAGANSPMATGSPDVAGQIPPPRPPAPMPAPARSACEPHREWIEAQVRLGRNATAIYQELTLRTLVDVGVRGFWSGYVRGHGRHPSHIVDRLKR